jgi:hypothetical protein
MVVIVGRALNNLFEQQLGHNISTAVPSETSVGSIRDFSGRQPFAHICVETDNHYQYSNHASDSGIGWWRLVPIFSGTIMTPIILTFLA